MKSILLGILLFQLLMSIAVAQITFTREWVTGKRSISPVDNQVLHKEGQCISFMPTIEFLMAVERERRKQCGPYLKVTPVIWKSPNEEAKGPVDDSMQYGPLSLNSKVGSQSA